ncbi:DUF3801 domain-containing protein [Luteococcus sp. H138]|uniref:DUF3801 domain-containing protein n=1 Tax=unclassified Luteococcus TaxID=2639923 RepID=UPI00313AF84C
MSLTEAAENQTERVTLEMSRGAVRATLAMTGGGLDNGRRAVMDALAHFRDALAQAATKRMKTGKVSLTTFAEQSHGQREVVSLDDKKLTREVSKQLQRYGVTFAVERSGDARTFHLAGADAQVMAHALDRATKTIDDRAARAAAKVSLADRIKEKVETKKASRGAEKLDKMVEHERPKSRGRN